MAQLRHDNIVQLVGVITRGQPMMLVLQFCELGALDHYLTKLASSHRQRLTDVGRLDMALDVARGMAFIHSKGFLHRDLACRNVLVRSDLRCCVADFGFARDHDYYQAFVAFSSLPPLKTFTLPPLTSCTNKTETAPDDCPFAGIRQSRSRSRPLASTATCGATAC